MLKIFKDVLGIGLFLLSIFTAIYVGFYLMLYKGLVEIFTGIQSVPLQAQMVALGVVKIMFASFVGWMIFLLGTFISNEISK
jgi:hypothetical protein